MSCDQGQTCQDLCAASQFYSCAADVVVLCPDWTGLVWSGLRELLLCAPLNPVLMVSFFSFPVLTG